MCTIKHTLIELMCTYNYNCKINVFLFLQSHAIPLYTYMYYLYSLVLFFTATLVIIILGSLLAGMVVLFLLAAIIVCLWLVTKKKVLICKNKRGESTSARRVLQTPPPRNTYYDSVRHNSSRSTSAVYDTVRRGNGPEIFITRSQETLRDASEHSSLRPLQVSPNNTYESPYDITTRPADLQAHTEGDPALSDTRVASPYYSYAYNGRKVELDQLREGENGWLAIVRGGRRLVKSWTGSEHVYI